MYFISTSLYVEVGNGCYNSIQLFQQILSEEWFVKFKIDD